MTEWLARNIKPSQWGKAALPDYWMWTQLPGAGIAAGSTKSSKPLFVTPMDVMSYASENDVEGVDEDAEVGIHELLTAFGYLKTGETPTSTTPKPVEVPEAIQEIMAELRAKGLDVTGMFIDADGNSQEINPVEPNETPAPLALAEAILHAGAEVLGQRAAERDLEQERSMVKITELFNSLTGKDLTEREGWLFMACLKLVRSQINGKVRIDDYIDGVNYLALAGEAHQKEQTK